MEARAILDSGSTASFVSERFAQGLHDWHKVCIYPAPTKTSVSRESLVSYVTLHIQSRLSSLQDPSKSFSVTAVIVSRVTSDLPLQPIPLNQTWSPSTCRPQLWKPWEYRPPWSGDIRGCSASRPASGEIQGQLLPWRRTSAGSGWQHQLVCYCSRRCDTPHHSGLQR